jgi:hypothetical protein
LETIISQADSVTQDVPLTEPVTPAQPQQAKRFTVACSRDGVPLPVAVEAYRLAALKGESREPLDQLSV